ncbi:hypothetical protein CFRS1_v003409 [Colletotrichum fructicola]|nr:hypothetical protein CFRS1_v003409 [Colletotrichum fructicola]
MSSSPEVIVALATLIISVPSAIVVIFRCIKGYRRHRLPQRGTYTTRQADFETTDSMQFKVRDIVLKTYRWFMSKPVQARQREALLFYTRRMNTAYVRLRT